MREVYFTSDRVAELLKRNRVTILRYVREGKFPGSKLRGNATKLGYAIPASVVLAYAEREDPSRVAVVRRAIGEEEDLADQELLAHVS